MFYGVVLLYFILTTSTGYSQERLMRSAVDKNIHSTLQTNLKQSENLLSQAEIQQAIDQLNDHLKAIDTKRVWINSSEERIVEANENDWFNQMSATEKDLIKRREELTVLLHKHKK